MVDIMATLINKAMIYKPRLYVNIPMRAKLIPAARTHTPVGLGVSSVSEDLLAAVLCLLRLIDESSDIPVFAVGI